jgi:hypothetical protein
VAELAATGRRQAVRLQGYDILRDRLQTLGQTQENENAAILQLARWVACAVPQPIGWRWCGHRRRLWGSKA